MKNITVSDDLKARFDDLARRAGWKLSNRGGPGSERSEFLSQLLDLWEEHEAGTSVAFPLYYQRNGKWERLRTAEEVDRAVERADKLTGRGRNDPTE